VAGAAMMWWLAHWAALSVVLSLVVGAAMARLSR